MVFLWDFAKAEVNWRKHKIHFEAASTIFDDPHIVLNEDRVIDGEQRWHAIGQSGEHVLLLVVHTIEGEWQDKIRTVSAPKAEKDERRIYASGLL